jgi:Tol biopolymer transport system component
MRILSKSLLRAFTALSLIFSLVITSTANAAFPGKNGRIVFSSNRPGPPAKFQIYTMNSDGSDLQQITHVPNAQFYQPVWSPDGKKIAFESNLGNISGHIFQAYSMNADGTDVTQLTHCTTSGGCAIPTWSPDGKKIAFIGADPNSVNIYGEWFVMNSNGTNVKQLTFASNDQQYLNGTPAKFTRDGKQIILTLPNLAFTSIAVYAVNVDGTNLRPYTAPDFQAFMGDLSPANTKIVVMDSALVNTSNIYIGKAKPFLVGAPSFIPITSANAEQITTDDEGNMGYATFSPDTKKLVIARDANLADVTGRTEINIVDLKNNNALTPITNNNNQSWNDMEPDWQPLPNDDGKFVTEDDEAD